MASSAGRSWCSAFYVDVKCMKTISILLQVILFILGVATIGAFLAKPSISAYEGGLLLFGLGVTAILWWACINLYKQAELNLYLPKVMIFSGALLLGYSAMNLLFLHSGHIASVSFVQLYCSLIAGWVSIRIGRRYQRLNKEK